MLPDVHQPEDGENSIWKLSPQEVGRAQGSYSHCHKLLDGSQNLHQSSCPSHLFAPPHNNTLKVGNVAQLVGRVLVSMYEALDSGSSSTDTVFGGTCLQSSIQEMET